MEIPCDPEIPFQGTYPELKSGYLRDTYVFMFIAPLFTIAKSGEQPVHRD